MVPGADPPIESVVILLVFRLCFLVYLEHMKWGGYHKAADGFTIVEVLIVIAVTGAMLISGVLLVNGRQSRTEFTTGINGQLQQFQQIINETASGFYPNAHDFTCMGDSAGPVTFTLAPVGSGGQGNNAGCIFLGKSVQFGLGSIDPTTGMLGIFPIVGNQYQNSGGNQVSSLTVGNAVPRPAYPISAAEESNVPQSTLDKETMQYGLHIASSNSSCTGVTTSAVCYMPVGGTAYKLTGMAAFLTGDSSGNITAIASGSATNLQSGSQQLSLYGVKVDPLSGVTTNTQVNLDPEKASASMGKIPRANTLPGNLGNLEPAQKVLVCVASGSTNQSGLFTISGSGVLSVTLKVIGDTTC